MLRFVSPILIALMIAGCNSPTPASNSTSNADVSQMIEQAIRATLTALPAASPKETPASVRTSFPAVATLSREQVVRARSMFDVQVLSFDASQEFGAEFPYSDYVRLNIKNGSDIVLPYLTILTKRLDGTGRMIGSSRAPSIYVADLKPGQSAEVDYYPRGHLPGVDTITVEIESLISPEDEQFFKELPR